MLSFGRRSIYVSSSHSLHSKFGFTQKVVGQRETPYSVLGVEESANPSEVKTAYKQLVVLHHPDKLTKPSRKDTERFHQIQAAYEEINKQTRPTSSKSSHNSQQAQYKSQDATSTSDKTMEFNTTSNGAIPKLVVCVVGAYVFSTWIKIRGVLRPHGTASLGESLVGLGKHMKGDPEFSWSNIDRMEKAKMIIRQSDAKANYNKSSSRSSNVHFLGEKVDEIRVRAKEVPTKKENLMNTFDSGILKSGMAITGNQYQNHKTDPARPVQLRLIKDKETGELRKKTMSERYNRQPSKRKGQRKFENFLIKLKLRWNWNTRWEIFHR